MLAAMRSPEKKRGRFIFQLPATAAVALVGWWLGESAGSSDPITGMLLAMALGAVIGLMAGGPGPLARTLSAPLIVSAGLAGHLGGSHSSQAAFNDCVYRGEEVRAAFTQYRLEHGRFPQRLSDLPGGAICGNRPLRGTLLHYERRGTENYALWFGDAFVVHEASGEAPFSAHK